jgi:hypothetical protein
MWLQILQFGGPLVAGLVLGRVGTIFEWRLKSENAALHKLLGMVDSLSTDAEASIRCRWKGHEDTPAETNVLVAKSDVGKAAERLFGPHDSFQGVLDALTRMDFALTPIDLPMRGAGRNCTVGIDIEALTVADAALRAAILKCAAGRWFRRLLGKHPSA